MPEASTKRWLQGLAPKFVIALDKQPRETTEWMREQYRRQAEQLAEHERTGAVPFGTATNFLAKIGDLDFKVDLGATNGIIEWPLLGKRADHYENQAQADWPARERIFYCLNPHMHSLQDAEKLRVGELSFRAASLADERSARERERSRVMASVKVSAIQRTNGGSDVPVEVAEVLRPAAEVFGVVAKEHGHYFGESKKGAPDATGRRTFVPPEERLPDPSMPPNAKRAAHSVLRLAPLCALEMTEEQKALHGVPETACRVAFVYPNHHIALQTYARDVKHLSAAAVQCPAVVTRALYTESVRGGSARIEADTPRAVSVRATRTFDLYLDADHTNAIDLLRLQEKYDLGGGVATIEQKRLQLRRFYYTSVESVARGTPARETGNAAATPPTNRYPCADEAHVGAFLSKSV